MKNLFKTYHLPSEEEFKSIWDNCLFVPDTNVLIGLYRYPQSTRETLLKLFEKINDRIWMPYQVGQEFYNNRLEVIYDQADAYDQVSAALDQSLEVFLKDFEKISIRHPYIDGKKIKDKINRTVELTKKHLKDLKQKHPEWSSKDEILNNIEKLFLNKVGVQYDENLLNDLYKEADQRYRLLIPPGFEDADKKIFPKKYGDFIIWKQIIAKAKDSKKPIIFITDEQKPDWWLKINGKFVGPRFELRKELNKEAGVDFYMYQTLRFIEYAKKYLKIDISETTINQIAQIKEFNERIKTLNESVNEVTSKLSGTVSSNNFDELLSSITESVSNASINGPLQESKIVNKNTGTNK